MSREIKFRIWDLDKKEWLGESDPHSLKFYGFHLIGECMTVQSPTKWQVRGIIEQYTGLKDKNGKEIYEGDVVQIPDDWDEYGIAAGQRYEVYFAYGGFRCKPWGGCKRRGDKGYWIEDSEDFEVVGNVHENPELLQEYKELD